MPGFSASLFPFCLPLSLHHNPGWVCISAVFQAGARSEVQQQLVLEQWDFLCQLEMVGEEGAFVLGWNEVLTEEELSVTLKVSGGRATGGRAEITQGEQLGEGEAVCRGTVVLMLLWEVW